MDTIRNAISDLWDHAWFKVFFGLAAIGSVPVFVMSLLMQSLHATVGD